MTRVTLTANLLLPVLAVFALCYVYFIGVDTFDDAFLSPTHWSQNRWVHPAAEIAMSTRCLYFAVWIVPVLFGLAGVFVALRLLLLVRAGTIFDQRVSCSLCWVGFYVAASGSADLFANFISRTILSLNNPSGPEAPNFYFDSEPAGLILCGGGFFLVGWIISEARRVTKEIEEFV